MDGRKYEIDLFNDNAEKLCEGLRLSMAIARPTPAGIAVHRKRIAGTLLPSDTAEIHAWTNENGYKVSDRGRIHQRIRDGYHTLSS